MTQHVRVRPDSRIDIDRGSLSADSLVISAGGEVAGTGTVTAKVKNSGQVSPGLSAGALQITGTYVQMPSATLTIELGDFDSGEWDRLAVSGGATLAGTLDLRRLPTFAAGPEDSFEIMTFTSRTGTFSNVTLDSAPLSGFNLVYGPTSITLTSSFPAQPVIASIVDAGNDQGRSVALRFARSGHDIPWSPMPVAQYEAFLRDDPLPAAAAGDVALEGATLEGAGSSRSKPVSDLSLLTPGWIFVGSMPANREDEYLMIAPTLADSTIADGLHRSVFFIRAATSDPGIYYDSPPASGYSLDNLAPGAPTGLAYSAGNLTWDESAAPDFDHFTVYGSNTSSFASAALIQYTVTPGLDVSGSPYAYYFVTATDFGGNEGDPAILDQSTDAGGPPKRFILSVSAHPNPFNPATTIRYTLPRSGRVKIAMHDAHGTRVATLLDAEQPAGAHTVPWGGRNDAGEVVTSGVYFARLEFGGDRRTYKTILLK